LSGASVADVDDIPGYPYAFSVRPKTSSRIYYFASTSEENKLQILNAVCDQQFKEKSGAGDSAACIIQ